MVYVGWPLGRVLLLAVSAMFLVIFLQVTMLHYRQNFRSAPMWSPVVETPLIALVAAVAAFINSTILLQVTGALLIIGVVSGLGGFYYHVRGVGERVGGYHLNNFLIGPPVMLPLTISAISALGLFALYWR